MCPEKNDDEMEFEYKTVDERASHDAAQEPSNDEEADRVEETGDTTAEDTDRQAGGDFDEQQTAEQMMADMDIYTILRMMIGMVAEQAWISLG
ncbi:MAG: hypothetical protein ACLFWB_08600, partial [Armatimonadota bacterium]